MRDRLQTERLSQKEPGRSDKTRIFNIVGNQSILQTIPGVIQRAINIPEYNEDQIRETIARMQDSLEGIGTNLNCSGFVDSVLNLAFDSKYCCWDSLKAAGARDGFKNAKDYDILLFYPQGINTVAKHISFKVGDNSVGRNQGNSQTQEVMFKKPIKDFVTEGFDIKFISAYDLMRNCGKRTAPADNDSNDGCCRVQ